MKAIQLLHIADTHIGVENYGRLDTATGLHTRLQDFVKCLEFAIDTALERDADAVLFAGDAYKQATPNPTHEGKFAEQMRRLRDQQIPVIMITSKDQETDRIWGMRQGAVDYLVKPITGKQLVAKINAVMAD